MPITETLFISDLHLHAERPDILSLFSRFLKNRVPHAEALYILGDLFEAWIGDDEDDVIYQNIQQQLSFATQSTPIYVMHGNRDFLLGKGFEQKTGCHLLAETHNIDLYGTPTLLMHGDSLCTEDVAYQQMRTQLRNTVWQEEFLDKPLIERRFMAKQLRERSKTDSAEKAEDIMDVTPSVVEAMLEKYAAKRLIHGHTHRPAVHDHNVNGQNCERIVLADWYKQGEVWVFSDEGGRREVIV
jgi:UDP-2,3-diacylglucosamine hydrolase